MVKRSIKQDLMMKEQELKMNLENNYKDLAKSALLEYEKAIEGHYSNGELKEKDYNKYKEKYNGYAAGMIGYHH